MKTSSTQQTTIDEYIAACPKEVRPILEKIRATIQKAAPKATETISYRMPSFVLNGHLVYFAAFKQHIGLYPPVKDEKLQEEASVYANEKGNLRFPLDEPIPYALIRKIILSRVKEQQRKEAAKKAKKGRR